MLLRPKRRKPQNIFPTLSDRRQAHCPLESVPEPEDDLQFSFVLSLITAARS